MISIQSLLSQVANNITPYQWEDTSFGSLRFDANTLPFPPPSLQLFLQKMKKNCLINEYADPAYKTLRKLIAKYENVDASMITVTNSGDEAIDILAKTFLNPGDYFITTPPTYEMFTIQCEINNGKPLPVPLVSKRWRIDAEKIIKESKNGKVKLIFLVNPNNPTASIIPPGQVEIIIKQSQAIVVVDEAYREFYGKTSVPLLKKYHNLVVLRSFSKFAGIAGARIGYLIGNPKLSEKFDAIRFPMGVSYLSYKLAETVLENDQEWIKTQVEMIKKERSKMATNFSSLGFYVYSSQANFLLVDMGEKAKKICQMLKERNIIVRDRSSKPYLQGCVRITIRSPQENNQLLQTLHTIIFRLEMINDLNHLV